MRGPLERLDVRTGDSSGVEGCLSSSELLGGVLGPLGSAFTCSSISLSGSGVPKSIVIVPSASLSVGFSHCVLRVIA